MTLGCKSDSAVVAAAVSENTQAASAAMKLSSLPSSSSLASSTAGSQTPSSASTTRSGRKLIPEHVLQTLRAGGELIDDAILCKTCDRFFVTLLSYERHEEDPDHVSRVRQMRKESRLMRGVRPCPKSRKRIEAIRKHNNKWRGNDRKENGGGIVYKNKVKKAASTSAKKKRRSGDKKSSSSKNRRVSASKGVSSSSATCRCVDNSFYYLCQRCDKGFYSRADLDRHNCSHADVNGDIGSVAKTSSAWETSKGNAEALTPPPQQQSSFATEALASAYLGIGESVKTRSRNRRSGYGCGDTIMPK